MISLPSVVDPLTPQPADHDPRETDHGSRTTVLAIDPGRDKCGLAVCAPGRVLHREIAPVDRLIDRVRALVAHHAVEAIIVGDQTGSEDILARLSGVRVPVRLVAERDSTLAARQRYFNDHPPRGFARFLPPGMRVPPVPYDDYAAVLLAERYLGDQMSDVGCRMSDVGSQ
jgi:RNase H-fold protein (predicted Holliday junction resolvase)